MEHKPAAPKSVETSRGHNSEFTERETTERALPRRRRPPQHGGELRFLYEDDDIIVVDKPAGLPVIAAEGSRAKTLYDMVTDKIKSKNPKGRAAVVHRLDRDTSGVLVFAKNARAKKALMEGWDDLAEKRRYVALVEGCPEAATGMMETWLLADGASRVRVAKAGERGAKLAATKYKVLSKGAGFGLLELELETGRKHQIRAQLSERGFPIAGDPKYGAKTDPLSRLGLHATLLVLVHPSTGERLRFESPAPPAFAAAVQNAAAAVASANRSKPERTGLFGAPLPRKRTIEERMPRRAAAHERNPDSRIPDRRKDSDKSRAKVGSDRGGEKIDARGAPRSGGATRSGGASRASGGSRPNGTSAKKSVRGSGPRGMGPVKKESGRRERYNKKDR